MTTLELFPNAGPESQAAEERLRRSAWTAANLLRGAGLNLLDAIDQTSFFLFLRLLESEPPSGSALDDLARATGDGPIRTCLAAETPVARFTHGVLPTLRAATHRESPVGEILFDFVPKVDDDDVFRKFLSVVESMSLDVADVDINGGLYERLIGPLAQAGHFGQFFTPRHIVDLMIDLVDPQPSESIHDPAVGSGGFLIAAGARLRERGTLRPKLSGRELDRVVRRLCVLNLLMHGYDPAGISAGSSLTPEAQRADHYDVIITNPPFAASLTGNTGIASFPVASSWIEALFLQHIAATLAPGGRAAVVCPEGLLTNLNGDRDVRAHILRHTSVEAVISLPSGVFNPYTAVRTGILVLEKTGRPTSSVWFFDVQNDGFSLDARRRPTSSSDLPEAAAAFRSRSGSTQSVSRDIDAIARNDLRLVASRYLSSAPTASRYAMTPLSEIVRLRREQVNPSRMGDKLVVCLGLEHVEAGTGRVSIPEPSPASEHKSVKAAFHAGDVLYGKLRPYLAKVFLAQSDGVASTELVVMEPMVDRVHGPYLSRVLRTANFTRQAAALMVGANHPRIHPKDLLGMEVPLPPLDVQVGLASTAEERELAAEAQRKAATDLDAEATELVAAVWEAEASTSGGEPETT